ncbi:hypothetical protein Naga_101005g3 [Nannochloropsis gaditana]|uniref:Uncharacterized protein n=1 Tax=Nannochloropsis gaditana TaxID=72520 RepID=W7TTX6_9STRA|nr:hypothetical protein Naga_101005g3 [Nannochloropsis gaditana]
MPPSGPTPLQKIDSNVSVEMLNRADRAAPAPFLKATKSVRAHSTRLFKPVKGFHERDDFHILLFASFCLCFNAGFVNTVTMSSYFAMTTSHVTGLDFLTTTSGVNLYDSPRSIKPWQAKPSETT